MDRRHFSAGAAALLLTPQAFAADSRFVLDRTLRGRWHAVGRFRNGLTGEARKLGVDFTGTWDGRVFTFGEDFFYADGERDRKVWRFTKIDDDRYEGARSDVTTPAPVTRESATVLRVRYSAGVATKSGSTNLTFDDRLELRDDGTILNTATVSKFFLVIGDIELVFRKGPLPARLKRTGGA